MGVLDLDCCVVDQNANRQRQPAKCHDVDRVASKLEKQSEVRIESGIERQTMTVLRQLPRNSRITTPVSTAAIGASRSTPLIAERTKTD